MENIEKKLNGFLGAAVSTAFVMTILGLIFVLFPGLMLSIMQAAISIVLISLGIFMIARDMNKGAVFNIFSTSLLGIFFVILGLIVALYYQQALSIITIAVGVYMILNSVMHLNIANQIRGTKAYNVTLLSNIIGVICGVLMIVHPGETNEAIVMIVGFILMVYGVSGLVDTFILKKKIDAVKDTVKKAAKETKKAAKSLIDEAKEAEIVDKKDEK